MSATHKPRGKWLAALCLLPFAVFFIAFQIAPLAWVALNSLNTPDGWGLGIRSQKRELDRAEDLAAPFVRILSEWYRVETVQVS